MESIAATSELLPRRDVSRCEEPAKVTTSTNVVTTTGARARADQQDDAHRGAADEGRSSLCGVERSRAEVSGSSTIVVFGAHSQDRLCYAIDSATILYAFIFMPIFGNGDGSHLAVTVLMSDGIADLTKNLFFGMNSEPPSAQHSQGRHTPTLLRASRESSLSGCPIR
jgi:hypothetical protein